MNSLSASHPFEVEKSHPWKKLKRIELTRPPLAGSLHEFNVGKMRTL